MKKFKVTSKVVVFMLMLSLCLGMSPAAGNTENTAAYIADTAEDNVERVVNGKKVVIAPEDVEFIPEQYIENIVARENDADIIMLSTAAGVIKNNHQNQAGLLADFPTPGGLQRIVVSKKTVTARNVRYKDVSMFSVATGAKLTLTRDYKASLKGTIEGSPFSVGNLGVTGEISYTYKKSWEFSGPPEDSGFNSRKYYVRFYANRGNWSQHYDFYNPVNAAYVSSSTPKTGTFAEIVDADQYKADSMLRP